MAPSHVYVWTCADPAKNKKRVAMQGGGGTLERGVVVLKGGCCVLGVEGTWLQVE